MRQLSRGRGIVRGGRRGKFVPGGAVDVCSDARNADDATGDA
jgi:hypothetical protein